jgi:hypothetical protein
MEELLPVARVLDRLGSEVEMWNGVDVCRRWEGSFSVECRVIVCCIGIHRVIEMP